MGTIEFYRGPAGGTLPGLSLDLEEALTKLRDLFRRERVLLAYLFGSYAGGEVRTTSDIDIAVLLDGQGRDLYSSYRELLLGVREALRTERFDLLLLNDASPILRFEIATHGRLIYARDDQTLNAFEMDAIRRFQDTVFLRETQAVYLRRRAREWYSKKRACSSG